MFKTLKTDYFQLWILYIKWLAHIYSGKTWRNQVYTTKVRKLTFLPDCWSDTRVTRVPLWIGYGDLLRGSLETKFSSQLWFFFIFVELLNKLLCVHQRFFFSNFSFLIKVRQFFKIIFCYKFVYSVVKNVSRYRDWWLENHNKWPK